MLRAAREVFEQYGYRAATVGAITERAATAHGTFYLYFKNKDDAFRRATTQITDELYTAADIDLHADPVGGVAAAIRSILQVFVRHGRLYRALIEATLQNRSIEAVWLDIRGSFIDLVVDVLREQQESGEVRSFDPELAASALGSMVEWFAFTHFVVDEPVESAALDAEIDRAVAMLSDLWAHAVYGTRAAEIADAD